MAAGISPQGLSLNPAPPTAVRVTKLAGIVGLIIVAGVLVLIVFGASRRRQKQVIESQDAAPREMSALSDSATLKDTLEKAVEDKPTLDGQSQQKVSDFVSSGVAPLPREQGRELAYRREVDALNAPAKVSSGSVARTQPASTLTPAPPTPSQSAANGPQGGGYAQFDQPNAQDQKEEFLTRARQRTEENYLKATRTAPLSPYEVKAGWDIPAVLEQAMNSDLPGEIRALVRANVYDTATGRYLLIPQGARLLGNYNSKVTYGQNGLQAVWTRIIFPDGSSLNLDGMNGLDQMGSSGLRSQVDHHYKSLFASAVLTSVLAAGFQLSQNTTGGQNVLLTPSPAQATAQGVGQQLSQLGVELTRKNLNVQPTIKIPIGYRFNVRVNRDIIFDGPYQPYSH
jgi:type IV secretion system protein VirB10